MRAHGFRYCFTPLPAVLFTFPSRYWFAIGLLIVFSLGGWCRRFQTGFLRSRPTQGNRPTRILARTGLSPCAAGLPRPFRFECFSILPALQPRKPLEASGLGSSPFARRYLGNHVCFLLLRVLRCFSSPGLPPQLRVSGSLQMGCPIRKSPDHGLFAPPRSLSQLITSFVASESQGIPRTLLVTFSILSNSLFLHVSPPHQGAADFSSLARLTPDKTRLIVKLIFLPACQRTFYSYLRVRVVIKNFFLTTYICKE